MEFNTIETIPNLQQIKKVANLLKGVVYQTPLHYSVELSKRFGAKIYLKREDLQVVRSYKIRGAYHKIANLPESLRQNGVVAASAGNHAQGVAFACAKLQIPATIFMPTTTPILKVDAVRFFGKGYVRIKLIGNTYDEAYLAARTFCQQHNRIFIPPFDDHDIIAGQATVALELLEQIQEPIDYLIMPFGGGGLCAGSSLVMEALSPNTQLVAVEPEEAPSYSNALKHGEVKALDTIDPFVDGAAVKLVGEKTFEICKERIHQVVLVNKKRICQTMLDLYDTESILSEPAGALSVAALPILAADIQGKTVVCMLSGGNFDSKRFPEIKSIVQG
jgi:threonine dehydratase